MSSSSAQIRIQPDTESDIQLPQTKKPRLETEIPDIQMTSIITPTTTTSPQEVEATSKKELSKLKRKNKNKKPDLPEPCSPDDVLYQEIKLVLGSDVVAKVIEDGVEFNSPFEFRQEVEVIVKSLSPGGDAVAVATDPEQAKTPWTIIVPFSLPGEIVRARVYRQSRLHSVADLVVVVKPNLEMRDNSRIGCKYFGTCGGCQYQMLSYDSQLAFKREVIVKAYTNFSGLSPSLVPPVQPTIGSPLQYNYRTKITPHFEAAQKSLQKKHQPDEEVTEQPDWLKIGFNVVGTRKVLDIEECPIATAVINDALKIERQKIIKHPYKYKRGVSLILRDSLDPSIPLPLTKPTTQDEIDNLTKSLDKHICVTSHKSTIREKVGELIFEYPASSFFQNNNSVLTPLTNYVRDAIFSPPSPSTSISSSTTTIISKKPTHLVDTYCGSGLFALTLSSQFSTIAGIELSSDSIRSAQHNVKINHLTSSISFRSGKAEGIFESVTEFPREETVVVIDPPRKGCDELFINQLVEFGASVVVYVSCNVHTQARDIGMILRLSEEKKLKGDGEGKGEGKMYVMESLRGFDLFPQTAHVESVAILRLV